MDKKHLNLASKGYHIEPLPNVASQKWLIYVHPVTGRQCRLPGDKASIRHYYAKGFKVYEPPSVEPMEIESAEIMVAEVEEIKVEEPSIPEIVKPKKKPKKKKRGGNT